MTRIKTKQPHSKRKYIIFTINTVINLLIFAFLLFDMPKRSDRRAKDSMHLKRKKSNHFPFSVEF